MKKRRIADQEEKAPTIDMPPPKHQDAIDLIPRRGKNEKRDE
jgi:hypothetical protein